MAFSDDIIQIGVVPTIKKFCWYANRLGISATAIYRTVAGLTPPLGQEFGRYYDSGNPLLSYAPFSGSVDALIAQGVVLRQTLLTALQGLVSVSETGDYQTDLPPAFISALSALISCMATPSDTISAMEILAGFKAPPLNIGQDQVAADATWLAARTAIFVRVLALIQMGAATALYEPTSSDDAIGLRNTVSGLLNREMTIASRYFNDVDYQAMDQVRIAVVSDLNARANQLAPVVVRTFGSNLPATVLAYHLYQDATRESDLVARNNPVSPALMPLSIECSAS